MAHGSYEGPNNRPGGHSTHTYRRGWDNFHVLDIYINELWQHNDWQDGRINSLEEWNQHRINDIKLLWASLWEHNSYRSNETKDLFQYNQHRSNEINNLKEDYKQLLKIDSELSKSINDLKQWNNHRTSETTELKQWNKHRVIDINNLKSTSDQLSTRLTELSKQYENIKQQHSQSTEKVEDLKQHNEHRIIEIRDLKTKDELLFKKFEDTCSNVIESNDLLKTLYTNQMEKTEAVELKLNNVMNVFKAFKEFVCTENPSFDCSEMPGKLVDFFDS